MNRNQFALLGIPILLAVAVFVIAPPVPLTTEADRIKARRLESVVVKPEPIPIPPEAAKMAAVANPARPAAPRTAAELAQIRTLLKQREETLLARKAKLPPFDRDGLKLLYQDILQYNEDLSAYDTAVAALSK